MNPRAELHICEKRIGIVPKTLRLILTKRLKYKRLKEETQDPILREVYDRRQAALKWILVTCFVTQSSYAQIDKVLTLQSVSLQ